MRPLLKLSTAPLCGFHLDRCGPCSMCGDWRGSVNIRGVGQAYRWDLGHKKIIGGVRLGGVGMFAGLPPPNAIDKICSTEGPSSAIFFSHSQPSIHSQWQPLSLISVSEENKLRAERGLRVLAEES